MSSKEALEILRECANGEKKLLFTDSLYLANIIKQDLERLEELERMVYTNQLENTKDIKNEFGRALTIFQNHCMAMEDTRYASDVLGRLNKENEKRKKAIKDLFEGNVVEWNNGYVYGDELERYFKEVLGE